MLDYSGDPRAERLLGMLLDPSYSQHSLGKMCQKVGMTILDLLDLLRRYRWDVGTIDVYIQLPQIVREIARDAQSSQAMCERCDGEGLLRLEGVAVRTCPHCKGSGKVRVPGDPHARRLILEILGVIGKNRSLEIQKLTS